MLNNDPSTLFHHPCPSTDNQSGGDNQFNPMGFGNNTGSGMGLMGMPQMRQQQGGCVLIVSNLEETRVTPDVLFTLFGVYGDVLRVKILFAKKDTALIQVGGGDDRIQLLLLMLLLLLL